MGRYGVACFEGDRGKVPEGGVAPMRVVPALDVVEEYHPRVGVGREAMPRETFAFQGRKEAFGHCVVVRIAP